MNQTKAFGSSAGVTLLRDNPSNPGSGMVAYIAPSYATGWQTGDIRRCWLADTVAGAATATEKITNGTFATDTSGWTVDGSTPTFTASAGVATLTNNASAGYAWQIIATEIGKSYQLSATITPGAGSSNPRVYAGASLNSGSYLTLQASGGGGSYSGQFVALGTSVWVHASTNSGTAGAVAQFDNVSVTEVIADRTYKAKPATIYGTLTRTAVAAAAQLVAYSGFSASNYLQEPYSADLDFGTGQWTCNAWVNIPATLPVANFPVIGGELVTNGDFSSDTWWTKDTGWAISGGVASRGTAAGFSSIWRPGLLTVGKSYLIQFDLVSISGGAVLIFAGGSTSSSFTTTGSKSVVLTCTGDGALYFQATSGATACTIDNVSVREVGAAVIAERSAASGPTQVLALRPNGVLVATAFDGTTTRTVTTTAAYNTATYLKARASYTLDGTLSISVNGRVVAQTFGTPLLTMNNASAVTTTGQSRTLDAPFPGSIALVKWGATVPSQEAMLWMYEQEKQMFRASAQVTLPSANSLLDVAYDDLTDTITVVDSGNEANFTGLVRTSTATVPAGTFSKVARGSGVKLAARITTTPGVDITIPSQNLKEELRKAEDAARRARLPMTFDYVGGFTATVTNLSTALTVVTGLSVPSTVNLRGVTVTGTGIPAATVITDIVGSTIYISKPATATNAGVSISMLEFPLPTGYEAEGVATAGALKQEGSTKDWTRSYDGFTEKIVYGAAPGSTAWVQARARRQA